MKLITRIAFATLLTTGFSITAQAADVKGRQHRRRILLFST